MIKPLICIAALAVITMPAMAQTGYASVTYLRVKPGMMEESLKLQRETGDKGAAATVAGGERTGYARMVRIFPSSHEVGHDVVYFYTLSAPPDYSKPGPDVFLKAIGMSAAEWLAKSRTYSDVVKMEAWSNVYSHGGIGKGDVVRVGLSDPPPGKTDAYVKYANEYEGPMRAHMVKNGVASAMQNWRLLLAPERAPYNFVNLASYAKGDGPFQPLPSRRKTFDAAHPGKDYQAYMELSDATVVSAGIVLYRVEAAIWK